MSRPARMRTEPFAAAAIREGDRILERGVVQTVLGVELYCAARSLLLIRTDRYAFTPEKYDTIEKVIRG